MSSIAMSTCLMLHVNIVVSAMLTYNTGVVNTSNMHVALRRHSDYYEESAFVDLDMHIWDIARS